MFILHGKRAQLWSAEPYGITAGAKWKKLYIHEARSEKLIRKKYPAWQLHARTQAGVIKKRRKSSRTADRDIMGKKYVFL